MSTHMNALAAPVAVGGASSGHLGGRFASLVAGWRKAFAEAVAMRRSLRELSLLSDRELSDIGLAHDEIHRLRSSEMFTPRGWRHPEIGRGDLPF